MSKKVKQIGCNMLKNLIEEDKLIINDFETIAELSSFASKAGSWEASQGAHDDLVMTCLLYTSPSPRDVEESRMPSSA